MVVNYITILLKWWPITSPGVEMVANYITSLLKWWSITSPVVEMVANYITILLKWWPITSPLCEMVHHHLTNFLEWWRTRQFWWSIAMGNFARGQKREPSAFSAGTQSTRAANPSKFCAPDSAAPFDCVPLATQQWSHAKTSQCRGGYGPQED